MRLFVYGVLIRELARGHAAELVAGLGQGMRAKAKGRLFALESAGGWYPVLLPDPDGGEVRGFLHEADAVDWAAMDAFENAHEGPDAEYVRREIEVTSADGARTRAFAYCYARGIPVDVEPIPDGDFAAWLRDTGRTAFA
tara:strand:- start:162 stop:581 length:420 start_codon:yes stop_codon:yes gene_type:complete